MLNVVRFERNKSKERIFVRKQKCTLTIDQYNNNLASWKEREVEKH